MCASSNAKIRDEQVAFYMGYYGGYISVEGKKYSQVKEESISRQEMFDILEHYKKSDIINLILDLIDNSAEG